MARRHGPPTHNHRWIGDSARSEVHDAEYESQRCGLDAVSRANHVVIFEPDTLAQAQMEGYVRCNYCTGYGAPP